MHMSSGFCSLEKKDRDFRDAGCLFVRRGEGVSIDHKIWCLIFREKVMPPHSVCMLLVIDTCL